jgi:hypothetical protein
MALLQRLAAKIGHDRFLKFMSVYPNGQLRSSEARPSEGPPRDV